jgi:hypothetical protein
MLDSLCGSERLADIARNDVLMGIAAPAVEFDAHFFAKVDADHQRAKDDGSLTRWRDEMALQQQLDAAARRDWRAAP